MSDDSQLCFDSHLCCKQVNKIISNTYGKPMKCNGDIGDEEILPEDLDSSLEDELRDIMCGISRAMDHINQEEYNNACYLLGYTHCELKHLIESLEPIEEEDHGQEN